MNELTEEDFQLLRRCRDGQLLRDHAGQVVRVRRDNIPGIGPAVTLEQFTDEYSTCIQLGSDLDAARNSDRPGVRYPLVPLAVAEMHPGELR